MPRYTSAERLQARKARLERHAAEDDAGVVLKAAARYLELRSRSVDEVRRHLRAARFPESLFEQAIARLVELGLLDDRAYAQAWVESRDRTRPRGSGALRRELVLKGIDRETIEGVLGGRRDTPEATEFGTGDVGPEARSPDERAAERLLQKSRSALSRVADLRTRRQRAYALLARNGFDPEVCRDVSARVTAVQTDAEDSGGQQPFE